jgi:hypothetical protein
VTDAVAAQRAITTAMRLVFGERAESIAIFVASSRKGQGIAECARAWGATEVRA